MKYESIALVIGFEPFGGDPLNPSQEIVRALDGETIAGHRIVAAVLPTEFARAETVLEKALEHHRPAVVIAFGQAGGREGISIERVAINVIDARIADNAGAQPVDAPVVADAPAAYFSTLPIKAMLKELHDANLPASISNTAGTFVCNQIFFALAHAIATHHPQLRGGFVHVPYLPEQAQRMGCAPSMPLQEMINAARICVRTALTTTSDLPIAAGTTH